MYQLAPGLALELEALPADLSIAVERFLAPFPKIAEASNSPLTLCGAPVPETNETWKLLSAEPPLELYRAGETLRIDSPAGVGWVEGERAGITAVSGQEEAAAGLLLAALLIELARCRGFLALHGAGIAIHGRAALLPAPSGSGKSTLYRRAARAGFDLLSDDLVWLCEAEDGSLHLHAFPRGAPCEPAPPPTIWEAKLSLIALPSIVAAPGCQAQELVFDELLRGLLDQGAVGVESQDQTLAFRRLVRAAREVPGVELQVGPDPSAGVNKLRELLTASPST